MKDAVAAHRCVTLTLHCLSFPLSSKSHQPPVVLVRSSAKKPPPMSSMDY